MIFLDIDYFFMQEEVVFVYVDFVGCFQDFGVYLEGEEQFVSFKQIAIGVFILYNYYNLLFNVFLKFIMK